MKRYMTTRERVTLSRRELGIKSRRVQLLGGPMKLRPLSPEVVAILVGHFRYVASGTVSRSGLKARGFFAGVKSVEFQRLRRSHDEQEANVA
jgi:hypothetical protein